MEDTMSKKILCALFFAMLSLIVLSSCKPARQFDVKFDSEEVNFGTLDQEQNTNLVFKFKNTGSAVLKILLVRPGCDCTMVGNWDKEIAPGKRGEIPVVFNTQAYQGEIMRPLEIKTNIPDREYIILRITGTVYTAVLITPKTILFDDILDDQKPLEGAFEIVNNQEIPMDISEIIPPDDKTTFTLTTVESHKIYKLNFTVHPPFEREILTNKSFTVKTKDLNRRPVKITFTYFLPPPVQISPMEVLVDIEKNKEEAAERRINIKSNMDLPIAVTDVKLDGVGVPYSVVQLLEDKFYQIPLVFPLGFDFPKNKPVFYLTFRVKNDPKNQLYSIPIKATEQPKTE